MFFGPVPMPARRRPPERIIHERPLRPAVVTVRATYTINDRRASSMPLGPLYIPPPPPEPLGGYKRRPSKRYDSKIKPRTTRIVFGGPDHVTQKQTAPAAL